jgi:hypothetical protein
MLALGDCYRPYETDSPEEARQKGWEGEMLGLEQLVGGCFVELVDQVVQVVFDGHDASGTLCSESGVWVAVCGVLCRLLTPRPYFVPTQCRHFARRGIVLVRHSWT